MVPGEAMMSRRRETVGKGKEIIGEMEKWGDFENLPG
jgi:hypothetical protein